MSKPQGKFIERHGNTLQYLTCKNKIHLLAFLALRFTAFIRGTASFPKYTPLSLCLRQKILPEAYTSWFLPEALLSYRNTHCVVFSCGTNNFLKQIPINVSQVYRISIGNSQCGYIENIIHSRYVFAL